MSMGALILVMLCTAVVTSGCADSSAEQAGGPKEALADFCHALLNLNEFVYVD